MTAHRFTMEKKLVEVDQEFMKKALLPYRPHATYLKRAWIEADISKGVQGLGARGEFSIPESCYIDDTGHFNAVEYNICYNQLGYVFFAYCIEYKLLQELGDYDTETFWKKQLPNFLIIKISSGFSKVLNAKRFYGTWGLKSVKKTSRCTFMHTWCDYYDDQEGTSKGEVTIGILPAHI